MKNLEDINILVIGDIMLDRYIEGTVERISPEAPVAIVNVIGEHSTLGGAGNVVRNIRELGPNVVCLSSISNDSNGNIILNKLTELGVTPLLVRDSKVTTTKERIIASDRKIQMLRIDREVIEDIDSTTLIETLTVDYNLEDFDMIIVSDYAKGVVTSKLMQYLNKSECKFIVDPKPKHKDIYGNPFLITPNEKEAMEMGGSDKLIIDGSQYVLETKGNRGMTLHDNTQNWNIDSEKIEVYNVSGAGDTVVSVMASCISMGWTPLDSAFIANKCACYVVTQPGTSTVPKEKFKRILKNYRKDNM